MSLPFGAEAYHEFLSPASQNQPGGSGFLGIPDSCSGSNIMFHNKWLAAAVETRSRISAGLSSPSLGSNRYRFGLPLLVLGSGHIVSAYGETTCRQVPESGILSSAPHSNRRDAGVRASRVLPLGTEAELADCPESRETLSVSAGANVVKARQSNDNAARTLLIKPPRIDNRSFI
jgi:hypothetical protein